jgi:hypothetical protein
MASHDISPFEPAAKIYRRHPLATPTSTRLVHIMPARLADHSDIIMCQLSVVLLDKNPNFRALSYVWGDPNATKTILVDGKSFTVRTNLWDFLSQMRRQQNFHAFWIDAISIDQSNLSERGHQVAVMGQIYSKATQVHVWLGPKNDSHVIAFKRLKEFDWSLLGADVSKTPSWSMRDLFDRKKRALAKLTKAKVDHTQIIVTDEHLAPILTLLESEYWTRLWIVQEFVLAHELILQCGSEILDGRLLESLYRPLIAQHHEWTRLKSLQRLPHPTFHLDWSLQKFLRIIVPLALKDSRRDRVQRRGSTFLDAPHLVTDLFLDQLRHSIGSCVLGLRIIHHIQVRVLQNPALQDYAHFAKLIIASRHSRCSDIHDHVYALLPLNPWASKEIVPDYEKSNLDLFLEMCQHFKLNFARGAGPSDKAQSVSCAVATMLGILGLEREHAQVSEQLEFFGVLPCLFEFQRFPVPS